MRTIPILRPRAGIDRGGARSTHASVAIEVDGLTVVRGGTVALDSVDLRIHAGELVAVIGPNGSGKSTLLEVVSGLLEPTTGTVRVFGRAPRDSHAIVAHVMQSTVANAAMPLTVLETVRMGCYARTGAFRMLTASDHEAVSDAIDRMRLGDLAHRQLQELSGGQRQRTYVAQGLAQQAEILLLDEPGTGLDLVTQETVAEAIRAEREAGRTIVLTTHDVGTARATDRVVLLSTRLVAAGTSAHVLTPEHLEDAYGGHIHLLDDGTVVLDDPHHHGVPGERGR
jgi:ABC-type Mn2+/Zn2+ transport system ATPase subunit